MRTQLIIFILLSPLLGLSQISSTQYYKWKKGAIFGDTIKVDGMGNSAIWDSTSQVIRSLSWGSRRDTLLLGGATFYSGGGDDEGTYAGDYSFYLGQDAGKDASHATYSVNTGTGYAAMQDYKGTYSTAFGGGSLRNTSGQFGFFNPTEPASDAGGISTAIGGSAGRDIPMLNASLFLGEGAGRAIPYSYRNVIAGVNAGTNYGSGYPSKSIAASVLLGSNSGFGIQGEQRNLIAIGYESALWANTGNRNIGIGTYSLYRRPGNGGFQGNDVIHIGHRTSDRNDGAYIYPIVPPDDLENLDSNIVIGNNIIPNGEKTINFPNWSLYLGDVNKSAQWDAAYNQIQSGYVSSVAGRTGAVTLNVGDITNAESTANRVNNLNTPGANTYPSTLAVASSLALKASNAALWDTASAIRNTINALDLQRTLNIGSSASVLNPIAIETNNSFVIGDFSDIDSDLNQSYIEINEAGNRINIEAEAINLIGETQVAGQIQVSQDIIMGVVGSWQYFGDPNADGSWRMGIESGTGNFIIQVRDTGNWTTRDTLTPTP